MVKIIETLDDIAEGLSALGVLDPTLGPIIEKTPNVPLRRQQPTLGNLMRIVVSQQVSVASASAIWARMTEEFDPEDASAIVEATIEDLQAVGLSRPKIKTLQAIAKENVQNGFNPAHLQGETLAAIHSRLTSIHGVGPWTSEIFALFCLGHPDIFPVGDIALQEAVRDIKGLDKRPKGEELTAIATTWAPWRGVAARLMWAHYAVMKGRGDAGPV